MRLQLQYNSDAPAPAAPGPADHSADTFLKEVAEPTIPAIEPGGFAPPPPGNSPGKPKGPEPKPAPVYTPPEGAKPIFDADDIPELDADTTGAAPAPERKLSQEYKDMIIEQIVNGEDKIAATICAMVAGQFDDDSPFRSSEQDLQDIVTALEPYKDEIAAKCPKYVPLVLMLMIKWAKQGSRAYQIGKLNKANKAAAADGEKVRRVGMAYTKDEARGNFTIYSDGYYARNRRGEYIKDRAKNKSLLEKPHIDDLDNILAVKGNRNPELLKAAFGWTDEDCKKHGIE